jgi:crotonobetainyl-CoA:carnitine CoA-transferase CaiB-like acyl-CoA transferase
MRNEYRLKPNRALSGRARLRPHPCNAARPPIRTVEGLGTVDGLHAIQEAFWEKHGLQCGYCTPATLMTAVELVEGNPNPSHWLIPALQEVLATLPQDEVARRCEHCNVSWAPVGQPGDLFTDPHLLATGGLVDVFISRFGGDGKFAGLPALPVEFGTDRHRPGLQRQPPRIGERNTEVLSEAGFTAAEIAGLAQAGVVAAQTG